MSRPSVRLPRGRRRPRPGRQENRGLQRRGMPVEDAGPSPVAMPELRGVVDANDPSALAIEQLAALLASMAIEVNPHLERNIAIARWEAKARG